MENQILSSFRKGIYFYNLPSMVPEKTHYPHTFVCLAEGFRSLGIPLYSNVNAWRLSIDTEDYLFRHDPEVVPDDCAVVVLDRGWFDVAQNSIPDCLFKPGRNYITVYMDSTDGAITRSWLPEFRQFDYIFKNHYLNGFHYPENIQPWGFGVSERMLRVLADAPSFDQRNRHFYISFRESKRHRHSVRRYMFDQLCPAIKPILPIHVLAESLNNAPSDAETYLYWAQTGRRHSPTYYEGLKASLTSACFSGFFIAPWPRNHATRISRLSKKILGTIPLQTPSIVQWDSWRFWESMAAGCVSFHADFEKYSFKLPVMPENWRHYIGVNFNNLQPTLERLQDEPECLEQIATEGRKWVQEHYSPVPTALRFLSVLSGQPIEWIQPVESQTPLQTAFCSSGGT